MRLRSLPLVEAREVRLEEAEAGLLEAKRSAEEEPPRSPAMVEDCAEGVCARQRSRRAFEDKRIEVAVV